MDNSVKSSLRNFIDVKSKQENLSLIDSTNLTHQLTGISKLMEDAVIKFTKRYLIISTELEEMKREFIGQASLVNEYVNLTKREIRLDKYDKFPNRSYANIPACPNYEQKCLKKEVKTISTATRPKKESTLNSEKKPKNSQKATTKVLSNLKVANQVNTPNNNANNSNLNQTNEGNKPLSKSIMKHFIQGSPSENKKNNKESANTPNANDQENRLKGKEPLSQQMNFQGLSVNEKEEYHKKVLDSFDDDFFKAIYILANSAILTIDERMKLCSVNKEISSKVVQSEIINDSLNALNTRIKQLEKVKESTPESERKVIETLCIYPTKTAQTGLNFLTSEREIELIQSDSEVNIQLLKMILACLEEEAEFSSVLEGYEYLFEKYNVPTIKVIYKKIYVESLDRNDFDKERVIEEIENNSDLITNSLVNNTNKTFSYVAFSLEEIEQHLRNLCKAGKVTVKKIKNELELKELKTQCEALCAKIR